MPIKIVKKQQGEELRAPAPLVTDALSAKAVVAQPERTPDVVLKDWQDNVVPPGAKPRQCAYCRCFYLKPCDVERSKKCLNFQHAQSKFGDIHA